MKKYLISFGLIAASIICTNLSFAQEKNNEELPNVTVSAKSKVAVVSAKVSKAFEQYFKGASNLKWYKIEKRYLVTFIKDDKKSKAVFTRSGDMVYHIMFGTESNLPKQVRHLVKRKYFDQTINRVYHVNQGGRSIWVVSLEDENEFVMVRVEENELEETQRLQKS